jgi:rhodanese-related sulfurtransferase
MSERRTVHELLEQARARIDRRTPQQAVESGAQIIDIRTTEQRRADGTVPDALWFPRNVLEWRVDPASDARDARVVGLGDELVIMCDEGYASSFAAADLRRLGFAQAADMDGGFQAWKRAGLPVAPLDENENEGSAAF